MDEISVQAKISEESQVNAALAANAAAFQAIGGWHLMLTEAVENSSDAILENMNEFGFAGKGKIIIKIDTKEENVRVIDNGTGIRKPFYILENPFKSLKKDVQYTKGQFGRGLWGFMAYCMELTYISKKSIIDEEKRATPPAGLGNTIRLRLFEKSSSSKFIYVDDKEFKKYCSFETGTVAIYKNWMMDFDDVSRGVQELYDRIQHHFGELIRRGKIKIAIQIDNKIPQEVIPREFDEGDRFAIEPVEVKDTRGNLLGKIEFNIYKAPKTRHKYKKPYLLVQDRPLQDSFICSFPEFEDHDVWKSELITGYVKCDFIEPNELRIGLKAGESKSRFVLYLTNAEKGLKKMIREFSKSLENAQLQDSMRNIAIDIQKFLKQEGGFNFKKLVEPGLLDMNLTASKVGVEAGKEDLEPISSKGIEKDVILVGIKDLSKLREYEKTGKHPWQEGGNGTNLDVHKDGTHEMTVNIDPTVQKFLGGRNRKFRPTGPGLVGHYNDLELDQLSSFDADAKYVIINTANPRFDQLYMQSKKNGKSENQYKRKLDVLISQQYLWHLVKRYSKVAQTRGTNTDDVDMYFWDLNYKYYEKRRL